MTVRFLCLLPIVAFAAFSQSGGVPAALQSVEQRLAGVESSVEQLSAGVEQSLTQLAAQLEQLSGGIGSLAGNDGRIAINQEKAMLGGITPLDQPGFPVTISEGGSYVLTSDLVVPDVNTTAIELFGVTGVTLDLNGFSIRGPNVCGASVAGGCNQTGNGSGIRTEGNVNGSVVFGGTITGMGASGVSLIGFGNTVRNMTVRNCRFGISATGLILDNVVNRNGNSGISSFNAVVKGNSATENGGVGITLFRGTASDNTSSNNGSFGFQSFSFFSGTTTPTPGAGYRGNFFADNNNGGTQVSEGTQLGPNVCGIGLCP